MGTLNKSFALILILIMTISSLSLMIVKPAYAQTTPPSWGYNISTPSIPTFTLNYVQSKVNITNPFRNLNDAQQVNNSTVEVTVKNQPFTPYTNTNTSTTVYLWYNIQVKGHSSDNWISIFPFYNSNTNPNYSLQIASNSENTEVSIPREDLPSESQVDFQVEAIIGTWYPQVKTNFGTFLYETSNWTNPQTINVPEPSTSPSPTPSIPEFPSWRIPSLLIVMVSSGLLVYFKKHKHLVKGLNCKSQT